MEFPNSEVFHEFLCPPQWLLFSTFHFTSKLYKTWHGGSTALGHCIAHITIPLHQTFLLKNTYKLHCSHPFAPHYPPSLALLIILDFVVLLAGTLFVPLSFTVPHTWSAFPPLTFTSCKAHSIMPMYHCRVKEMVNTEMKPYFCALSEL